jgi:hypothetical protein
LDVVESAKKRLARPATALIVMASIQSVYPAIVLVCGVFWFMGGGPSKIESIMLLIASALFSTQIVIAIGAAKMGFLESYAMARTAAILACIPFVTPFVFVGIPFGIWSLKLLADPAIIRAFHTAHERQESA